MITKQDKEIIIQDLKKVHPDAIYTTRELAAYTKYCTQTLKNYSYIGMPRIGKNRWYVPEVIFWITYILPAIQEKKKHQYQD